MMMDDDGMSHIMSSLVATAASSAVGWRCLSAAAGIPKGCVSPLAFAVLSATKRAARHNSTNGRMLRLRLQARGRKNHNPDHDDGEPFWDAFLNGLTVPVPIPFLRDQPGLALGYPLALVGSYAIVPPSTSIFLTLFFVGFLVLGRVVVTQSQEDDDDDDDDDFIGTDLAAFLGALASAGLLSPSGLTSVENNGSSVSSVGMVALVLGLTVIISGIGQFAEENENERLEEDTALSPDEELLN
eukprot:scaffold15475_cov47-Attheya_sp.AAC.1